MSPGPGPLPPGAASPTGFVWPLEVRQEPDTTGCPGSPTAHSPSRAPQPSSTMPGKSPGDGAFKSPRGRETSAYRSSAHWPPTRRLMHSHAHKHMHTPCSEHRVRAELQKPSDKCTCIRLASPAAEAVFLARGCPGHSEEPEGTEKTWAGRCFPGRRVCAFRGFLPQSGPLRQGGHTAAWGSHTRSRMISTPPAPDP